MRRSASTFITGSIDLCILSGWSDDEDGTSAPALVAPSAPAVAHAPSDEPEVTVHAPMPGIVSAIASTPPQGGAAQGPASSASHVVVVDDAPTSAPDGEAGDRHNMRVHYSMTEMLKAFRLDAGPVLVRKSWAPWEYWMNGVADYISIRVVKNNQKEGTILRQAQQDCKDIISQSAGCQFKVGVATSVLTRWRYYRGRESKWVPTLLFVITAVDNRSGACFLEAGIILALELWAESQHRTWPHKCMNTERKDTGGGGARWAETELSPHYVYLAVRPLSTPIR